MHALTAGMSVVIYLGLLFYREKKYIYCNPFCFSVFPVKPITLIWKEIKYLVSGKPFLIIILSYLSGFCFIYDTCAFGNVVLFLLSTLINSLVLTIICIFFKYKFKTRLANDLTTILAFAFIFHVQFLLIAEKAMASWVYINPLATSLQFFLISDSSVLLLLNYAILLLFYSVVGIILRYYGFKYWIK